MLGRHNVEVLFQDDQYTPNTAIQACRSSANDAFLVVGGGGTDQIQACGQFAEQAGVPYLSPGVTEAGLTRPPLVLRERRCPTPSRPTCWPST